VWLLNPAPLGALTPPRSPRVDFERHVVAVFSRAGCNSGSCHGSFQGKNGFRLSLFGYDPEKDYLSLTREAAGRRVDPVEPERSLLLLKAAGLVPHGGGRRFSRDSWQYRLLRDWIASGARRHKGSGDVAALTIAPPECAFGRAGATRQLTVKARFADGAEEDVTRLCDFRVNDDAVADVSPQGRVKGLRRGDTAVVVSYRGNLVPVRVLVPAPAPPGFTYPDVPEANYVDRLVFAKLRRLNVVPSDPSGDAEFLRRVTIDTIGCLPSPDEVRAFLADTARNKRAAKVEELLAHPMHAALWATKFCDITGNNTDRLELPREKRSKMWHDWFRKRLVENRPYDEIVRGVLCATSREGKSPEAWVEQAKAIEEAAQKGFDAPYAARDTLDLFWRRQQRVPIEQWGEKTAAAFMGVRLECAQCHKHPFDRWTQADYRAHANIFGQVRYAVSPEARKVIQAANAELRKVPPAKGQRIPPLRELYVAAGRPLALPHPDTNRPLPPQALGGPVIAIRDGQDARAALFDWLRAPNHPYFARSFVNRVWGHYLGVGIVEPVDDFSLANPPANPQLLDTLARDFIDHQFDIRHVERTILMSRTYQLSSAPNATNRLDRNNYSHGYVRRLMAEAVVDVLNSALGVGEDLGRAPDVPPGIRAVEVGPSRVRNGNLAYVFRIFGRPPRSQACDCERAMEPALPQALYLMTDQVVLQKIRQGRLARLLRSDKSDAAILDELFLATLSRYPTRAEKDHFDKYRQAGKGRQAVFTDTLWALINTREFILNH
jgi:hypothetical protein